MISQAVHKSKKTNGLSWLYFTFAEKGAQTFNVFCKIITSIFPFDPQRPDLLGFSKKATELDGN